MNKTSKEGDYVEKKIEHFVDCIEGVMYQVHNFVLYKYFCIERASPQSIRVDCFNKDRVPVNSFELLLQGFPETVENDIMAYVSSDGKYFHVYSTAGIVIETTYEI